MSGARHAIPPSRGVLRRRSRRQRRVALLLLASLFASAGVMTSTLPVTQGAYATVRPFDAANAVTRGSLTSRVGVRVDGTWSLGDGAETTTAVTAIPAGNPTVKALINGRDEGRTPEGFNPDHATGDTGNAYEYSQCTWWAYVRRHQLGLPAGSHMGNGADWAGTARRLGYWVDGTPRVGDVICFQRGQYGSDAAYGHVAIVEAVNADGSITTSECGAAMNGKTYSRTLTAEQAKTLQFIHY